MPLLGAHPHKHLIRDLWPDKHLYAAILVTLAALIGAAFAIAARIVPVTFASDMRTSVAGWNWPFGVVLPAIAVPLAIASYRLRRPSLGFAAAAIEIVSFGALAVSSLLGLVAMAVLVRARAEREHENPLTRDLHPHHWPDKSLAAALLFTIAGLSLLVWGTMLLLDGLTVGTIRTSVVTLWGVASLLVATVSLVAAVFAYRQRTYWGCVGAAVVVGFSLAFVLVGPALAIGAALLLRRAHREGEFAA